MKRKLTLVILLILGLKLQAQTDSDAVKVNLARRDVKQFRLDQDKWLAYKKHQIPNTSDYFKPVKAVVSNSALLTDSVYVKAYREAANKKTLKRHSTGHYFLIGGVVFVTAIGLSYIIISAIFLASL